MNHTHKALIVGVALTGLLAGASNRVQAATANGASSSSAAFVKAGLQIADGDTDTHSCKGQNTCKGKGGCKTGDNGCKGKNSCKGKGGCKTTAS